MSTPPSYPSRMARAATAQTLRQATLNPYDVIVLAAVEAANNEPGRMTLPTTDEVAAAARLSGQATLACLEAHLVRQRLVGEVDGAWSLTPLGKEVLAELIRKDRRQQQRRGG